MSKKIYRAVIYCRVSQEDAGNKLESNSITTQKLFCEEYVRKQEDIELVHEPIVDDGVSGVTHDIEIPTKYCHFFKKRTNFKFAHLPEVCSISWVATFGRLLPR
ncbi:MAG: recombinase family protein, partial [Bacillota bacterium]